MKKVVSFLMIVSLHLAFAFNGVGQINRTINTKVADALGYDVVEFREGYLEKIPVETKTVDLVTSNCVVNLSPDKPRVFEEIWRVLKDHGRIVISDIVSETDVPPHLKVNPQLWVSVWWVR